MMTSGRAALGISIAALILASVSVAPALADHTEMHSLEMRVAALEAQLQRRQADIGRVPNAKASAQNTLYVDAVTERAALIRRTIDAIDAVGVETILVDTTILATPRGHVAGLTSLIKRFAPTLLSNVAVNGVVHLFERGGNAIASHFQVHDFTDSRGDDAESMVGVVGVGPDQSREFGVRRILSITPNTSPREIADPPYAAEDHIEVGVGVYIANESNRQRGQTRYGRLRYGMVIDDATARSRGSPHTMGTALLIDTAGESGLVVRGGQRRAVSVEGSHGVAISLPSGQAIEWRREDGTAVQLRHNPDTDAVEIDGVPVMEATRLNGR
jgi:hypothetical protein